MIQTHEHMDHYFGLPAVTKYNPNIHIYTPNTFYPNGKQYLKDCGHRGKWTEVPKGLFKLQEGVALYDFDCPIIFKVFGEMSMYCNVKDVGLVSITGCCHQGIILFADTAYKTIAYEKDQFYGLYGGLHISPFDDWDPKYDDLVIGLQKVGTAKGGLQPLHGPHHGAEIRGCGLSRGQGHGPIPFKTTNYLGNGDDQSSLPKRTASPGRGDIRCAPDLPVCRSPLQPKGVLPCILPPCCPDRSPPKTVRKAPPS